MALVPYERVTLREYATVKGCRPGTAALHRELKARVAANPGFDPNPALNGCFNHRMARGSVVTPSLHSGGRAIDLGIRLNPAGIQLGNFLTFALIAKAPLLGIQRIIWRGHIYTPGESPRAVRRKGNATLDHDNHLHIELINHTADHMNDQWVRGVLGG